MRWKERNILSLRPQEASWCLQAEVGSLWVKERLPVHRESADHDTRVLGRTEEEADRDKKNKVSG